LDLGFASFRGSGETVIVLGGAGCIASQVTVSRNLVVRKPAALSVAETVSLPATFLTAHYAPNHLGRMRRGDRVVIHTAAAGVGLAAVQFAQGSGAEVLAIAGSAERCEYLKALGVTHVMSSHRAPNSLSRPADVVSTWC
jgi:NADPH:quinone reductase-like Zn-dependent oxidoreductase